MGFYLNLRIGDMYNVKDWHNLRGFVVSADRFPESLEFRVEKRSLEGSGSGPGFGVTGLGLAVAASPVVGDAGQITRCGPLAYALAPTVECSTSPL
jgi:hypothetical protein